MAATAARAATSGSRRSTNLNTLIDYRYQQHFKAKNGGNGMGKEMTGASGADVVLKVPVGTKIYEEDGETLIADLATPGERVVLLARRQWRLRQRAFQDPRPTRRRAAPIPASPAKRRRIWLRLKLIADAGLIGLPNAGKSTFLPRRHRGASPRSPTIRSPRCTPSSAW